MKPGEAYVSLGPTTTKGSSQSISVNSSGIVYQTEGFAHGVSLSTGSVNNSQWKAAGLFIAPTDVDNTPYRVKGWLQSEDSKGLMLVGYGPLAVTGSSDIVTKVVAFNGNRGFTLFDDVILMPRLFPSDDDFGKPIFFGLGVTSAPNDTIELTLSVQNLARTSPQFGASMS